MRTLTAGEVAWAAHTLVVEHARLILDTHGDAEIAAYLDFNALSAGARALLASELRRQWVERRDAEAARKLGIEPDPLFAPIAEEAAA